jgi:predicted permease
MQFGSFHYLGGQKLTFWVSGDPLGMLLEIGRAVQTRGHLPMQRGLLFVETIRQDIRLGFRRLCKSPGVTLIAVLTLALGIGANTAVFTLAWTIILKGLPVPHPDRLVEYVMDNGAPTTIGLSGPEFTILQREQRDCIGLLAWMSDRTVLRLDGRSEQVPIQMLSNNTFQVMEMRPYLGNFFSAREDAPENSEGIPAILSYGLWQKEFNGDASALGRTLFVANLPVTVIGVMPKPFEGLTANFDPALYLPLSFADRMYGNGFLESPRHFVYYVLGRMKPGMTVAAANAEAMALEPAIRREADPTGIYMNQIFKGFRLRAREGRSGISWVKEVYSRPLLVLEILVVFLLMLTCLNTALVMLARVSGRQQEYAVRSALGAGRHRLVRQVLVETILLIVPGLACGVLIGWGSARALVTMLGSMGSASSMDVHPNAIILGFNVGIGLFLALGAGLWPALRAATAHPAWDLKAGDRSVAARQLGGWVVILQVAVSACLVAAAVLLGGTLGRFLTEDSGIDAEGTALASIRLNPNNSESSERTVGALLWSARNKPGVMAAGFSGTAPLSGFAGASREFGVDSHGNVHSDANVLDRWVSSGYFSAAGTRLLRGESSSAVAAGAMAQCVLSDNFAATVFPGESPVGRIIYPATEGQPDGANLDPKAGCLVVGVAENARLVSLRAEAPHVVYNVISPWVESEENRGLFSRLGVNLVVRARTSSLAVAALQDAVKETIPGVEEVRYRTFHQLEDSDLNRERMLVSVSGSLALLALLLTALGLYGLLMRSVVLRTREIGIRVALGAQKSEVVMAVARKTMLDIGAGLLAGEAAAFFLTKGIRQLLEIPQPRTMTPYLWSSGILLLVGAIAIFFPARRIISVDPIEALRTD